MIPAGLSVVAFGWILDCDLYLDDFLHLYDLTNYGYLRLVLTPHGGHLLLTSNSAYFVLHALFGIVSRWWFLTVLVTHAINVLLLFRLLNALTGRPILATVLATFWALNLTNAGSLSWFAVYGNVLVATFILWLVGDMVCLGASGRSPSAATLIRWVFLLLAAASSFGVGLGIGISFGPVAFLLLPHARHRARLAFTFGACSVALVGLYLGQRALYFHFWNQHPIPFDPAPALLSGASDPRRFLALIGVVFCELVSYGVASLLVGPLVASLGNTVIAGPSQGADPSHFCLALAATLVALSIVILWRAFAERQRIAWGLHLLVAACYAPVAVIIAARVLSLESFSGGVAHLVRWSFMEPRYHYVGPALLAACLGIVLACAMDRWPRSVGPIQYALIVWLMVLSPLYWKARAALVTGSARVLSAEGTMDRIRSIVRQYPAGGQAYVQNKPFLLWHDLNFPGLAAVFVLSNPDNTLDGRRVHFIESDPELLAALKREGGRVADLLVSGEEPTVVREMF